VSESQNYTSSKVGRNCCSCNK